MPLDIASFPAPQVLVQLCTPERLDDVVAKNARWVESCLADRTSRSWTPHVWVEVWNPAAGEQQVLMHSLMIDFNTAEEKRRALEGVGLRVYRDQLVPLHVVLTSQVWMSRDPQRIQPILDPNKREGMIVAGMSLAKHVAITSAEITRDKGRIQAVKFGELQQDARFPLLTAFWMGFAASALLETAR